MSPRTRTFRGLFIVAACGPSDRDFISFSEADSSTTGRSSSTEHEGDDSGHGRLDQLDRNPHRVDLERWFGR